MSAVYSVCCHTFRFQRFQLPKGVPLLVNGFRVCVLCNVTKCVACVVESTHVSSPSRVTYTRRVLRFLLRFFWVELLGGSEWFRGFRVYKILTSLIEFRVQDLGLRVGVLGFRVSDSMASIPTVLHLSF